MQRIMLFTQASFLLILTARADYKSVAAINGQPVSVAEQAPSKDQAHES